MLEFIIIWILEFCLHIFLKKVQDPRKHPRQKAWKQALMAFMR